MFQLDKRDLNFLNRLYNKWPRQFARGTGMMLNTFAFGTRREAIAWLPRKQTIRNKRFMARQLRVEKSRTGPPIEAQMSTVGSVPKDRFTGWVEQETGLADPRGHAGTLYSRGKRKTRQIKKGFRFLPGKDFAHSSDYPGDPAGGIADEDQRAFVMIRTLSRAGYREPFIVRRYKKVKAGMYKFKGRKNKQKLVMVQSIRPKSRRIKRIRWMETSRGRYFRSVSLEKEWGLVMKRILKYK